MKCYCSKIMQPISYNNLCLILVSEEIDPTEIPEIGPKKDLVMCPSCLQVASRDKHRTHRNDYDFVTIS